MERKTRYLMLAKVAGKDTETVVDALIKRAQKLPRKLYKSLTLERGIDLSDIPQGKLNAIARRLNALANVLRRSVESAAGSGH